MSRAGVLVALAAVAAGVLVALAAVAAGVIAVRVIVPLARDHGDRVEHERRLRDRDRAAAALVVG